MRGGRVEIWQNWCKMRIAKMMKVQRSRGWQSNTPCTPLLKTTGAADFDPPTFRQARKDFNELLFGAIDSMSADAVKVMFGKIMRRQKGGPKNIRKIDPRSTNHFWDPERQKKLNLAHI